MGIIGNGSSMMQWLEVTRQRHTSACCTHFLDLQFSCYQYGLTHRLSSHAVLHFGCLQHGKSASACFLPTACLSQKAQHAKDGEGLLLRTLLRQAWAQTS